MVVADDYGWRKCCGDLWARRPRVQIIPDPVTTDDLNAVDRIHAVVQQILNENVAAWPLDNVLVVPGPGHPQTGAAPADAPVARGRAAGETTAFEQRPRNDAVLHRPTPPPQHQQSAGPQHQHQQPAGPQQQHQQPAGPQQQHQQPSGPQQPDPSVSDTETDPFSSDNLPR